MNEHNEEIGVFGQALIMEDGTEVVVARRRKEGLIMTLLLN